MQLLLLGSLAKREYPRRILKCIYEFCNAILRAKREEEEVPSSQLSKYR